MRIDAMAGKGWQYWSQNRKDLAGTTRQLMAQAIRVSPIHFWSAMARIVMAFLLAYAWIRDVSWIWAGVLAVIAAMLSGMAVIYRRCQ